MVATVKFGTNNMHDGFLPPHLDAWLDVILSDSASLSFRAYHQRIKEGFDELLRGGVITERGFNNQQHQIGFEQDYALVGNIGSSPEHKIHRLFSPESMRRDTLRN